MFMVKRKEFSWNGVPVVIETGKLARQADGSVMVSYGDTRILATAVVAKTPMAGVDFLPLSVHYQEKSFAFGRIPGGFIKREGRPSERETLYSRLIDRPIRPLFPEGFYHEMQVLCTVLSYDGERSPDIPAIIAASAALALSGAPFKGPVGAAKVGLIDGKFVLNPTLQEEALSDLDLVVAGTDQGVLMVESEAKELSESMMLEAVMFGHEHYQEVIVAIKDLVKECAVTPLTLPVAKDFSEIRSSVANKFTGEIKEAYSIKEKQERSQTLSALRKKVCSEMSNDDVDAVQVGSIFHDLETRLVREELIQSSRRIDGRKPDEIRPIACEIGFLPKVHGSSLFTRGETQALVAVTLGIAGDAQSIEGLEGDEKEKFMLHYNFPPYSVGEIGRMGAVSRREIGHGRLAWRSIRPMLPEENPYTIRIVSEITESNGSSSMATVCGSSMALMDTGVPLKKPVAGIAMGLVKEGGKFVVLSDILGDEDHLGDMDFKVAGSRDGVTALQMDLKITSVNKEIMETALNQAKQGRLHILGEMAKAISQAKEELSDSAPRIETLTINKDKIKDVIGSGGKVIREICEVHNVKVDINDDGVVTICSSDAGGLKGAVKFIQELTCEPEIGKTYTGKVVKIMEFGAFVNFVGNQDGLVHISEISNKRVNAVTDFLKEGDEITVKLIGMERGKYKLSIKALS